MRLQDLLGRLPASLVCPARATASALDTASPIHAPVIVRTMGAAALSSAAASMMAVQGARGPQACIFCFIDLRSAVPHMVSMPDDIGDFVSEVHCIVTGFG